MIKRASKRPRAVPKKVAAPLRLSPNAVKKHSRESGIEVEADVALLVRELGSMIDATHAPMTVWTNRPRHVA
jgi:hypothetical protein